MRAAAAVGIVLVFGLGSCGAAGVDLGTSPRSYKSSDYEKVLHRWTRTGRIFDHFDTNLKAYATYFSWDFTWAYAVRWAKTYRLDGKEAVALRRRLLSEKAKHHEFYLAVTTQDLRWNDLDHDDSIWQVRLVTSAGVKIAPSKIERIVPIKAVHRSFFPYTKTFYYAYRVRFPVTVAGNKVLGPHLKWFALRFSGPKGVVSLRWTTRSRP